jgi:hypothetical protein
VIWLLLVGVFLVVVSSVVLAATQWQSVPPVGQYGILLVYTLAFWQLGQWTHRQGNLQATSRMLRVMTLLVIPLNFWMMSALALRQNPLGMGLAAIAALGLSAITVQILGARPRWLAANGVLLSWLHWGWQGWVPLAALYGGAAVTAGLLYWRRSPRPLGGSLVLVAAWGLLLGRGWLVAGVPPTQAALAVALLGWGLVGQSRRMPTSKAEGKSRSLRSQQRVIHSLGLTLLGMGWLLAWGSGPLAGVLLNGLVLWTLAAPLRQSGQSGQSGRRGLWVLALGVALQGYGHLWGLLPGAVRSRLVEGLGAWVGVDGSGLQLLGLGLLPFLLGLVVISGRLRRSRHLALAPVTEIFALGLGGLGLVPSVGQVGPRSLYLLGLTGVMVWGYRQAPHRPPWAGYLLHGTGLLALLTLLDWLLPGTEGYRWGWIFLAIALGEWGWLLWGNGAGGLSRPWRQQSWFLGLGLAIASYLILQPQMSFGESSSWAPYRGLPWLLVPLGLTGLSEWSDRREQEAPGEQGSRGATIPPSSQSAGMGVALGALAVALGLTTPLAALIALVTVAGCTGWLSRRLTHQGVALLTVGWGLGAVLVLLFNYLPNGWASGTGLAVVLWGLWLLRAGLQRRRDALSQRYSNSCNLWAIALAGVLLTGATGLLLGQLLALDLPLPPRWSALLPMLSLTVAAIAFRLWQTPTHLGYLALAWGGELLLLQGWLRLDTSPDALLLGHAGLALGTQLLGDVGIRYWRSRPRSPVRMTSWAIIPLGFGALTLAQAHLLPFSATTGLYTVAVGLVGIGVGRRLPQWTLFTYGGAALLSLGAYEGLGYGLSQQSGGELGDGIGLLGLLATAIALVTRTALPGLLRWWRWPAAHGRWFAHLHWGLAVVQVGVAVVMGVSATGRLLVIVQGMLLAGYGVVQGRRFPQWIDSGVTLGLLTLLYALPPSLAWNWGGAIVALVSVGLRGMPWSRWGWPLAPWQRSAGLWPGLVAGVSLGVARPASTLVVAAFYGGLALKEQRPRLSYIGVGLGAIALLQWLLPWLGTGGWPMALASGAALYGAQVDPALHPPDRRQQRHWVRSLAVALLSLTAFLEAGTGFGPTLLVAALGLGMGGVGLWLRVRAYLYVGTLTFALEVINLLWTFISQQALLLWALGIVVGLGLIWLAATFEARRSQANALLEDWLGQLEDWQ